MRKRLANVANGNVMKKRAKILPAHPERARLLFEANLRFDCKRKFCRSIAESAIPTKIAPRISHTNKSVFFLDFKNK
jgi:hypothetical protein